MYQDAIIFNAHKFMNESFYRKTDNFLLTIWLRRFYSSYEQDFLVNLKGAKDQLDSACAFVTRKLFVEAKYLHS